MAKWRELHVLRGAQLNTWSLYSCFKWLLNFWNVLFLLSSSRRGKGSSAITMCLFLSFLPVAVGCVLEAEPFPDQNMPPFSLPCAPALVSSVGEVIAKRGALFCNSHLVSMKKEEEREGWEVRSQEWVWQCNRTSNEIAQVFTTNNHLCCLTASEAEVWELLAWSPTSNYHTEVISLPGVWYGHQLTCMQVFG